jgi:hypothetical protein
MGNDIEMSEILRFAAFFHCFKQLGTKVGIWMG